MTVVSEFDEHASLPLSGTHVLDASAGTGKTHTIKKLVARYLRETDVQISEILVMTFGRSATQELRERVRTELWDQLASATGHERDRLERAVSNLDTATISTTHEFCSRAFAGLGLRADRDPGEAVTDDLTDLRLDAATDVYLGQFAADPPGDLSASTAEQISSTVVNDPISPILGGGDVAVEGSHSPSVTGDAPEHQQRIAYAEAVRAAVRSYQHAERLVSYDDLVLRLRDALRSPSTTDDVAQRLRKQYRVVLIDEFQDTDPAQWEIVERAFHGHTAVLLIGDPKQGIYAFRGADINSYLTALAVSEDQQTLPKNYRSDAAVVDGVSELLQFGRPKRGIELGDPAIDVRTITAYIDGPRLTGAGLDPRLRVRLRVIDAGSAVLGARREAVARDVAADARSLLDARPMLSFATGHVGPPAPAPRPLAAGDIAVIVRTNAQARLVKEMLRVAGVHSVINSTESVFASPACYSLLALLRAMEDPRPDTFRRALLSGLVPETPDDLLKDPDLALQGVAERVRGYQRSFARGGVPALLAELHADPALVSRSLQRAEGERLLTDLRHLSALLHQAERQRGRGLNGLVDWLSDEFAEAGGGEGSEALTRRLESDADAVQVITIHRSKGLQYPVTYVPYGWDRAAPRAGATVRFTRPDRRRVIDVRGGGAPGRAAGEEQAAAETAGEDLRMLYVALTRASSLVIVTAMRGENKPVSNPLDRVLWARRLGHRAPERVYPHPPPVPSFEHVQVEGPFPLDATSAALAAAGGATAPAAESTQLSAAPYDRTDIDTAWGRTSFTSVTSGEPHGSAIGTPDDDAGEKTDEPSTGSSPDTAEATAAPAFDGSSPFADLPAGTSFGSLVHGVLEHVDTNTGDLPAELVRRCSEQLALRPMAGLTPAALAAALEPVMATPLGRLAPESTLASIPMADRLAEMDFEMPLQQGRSAGQTVAAIGELLARQTDEPAWVRAYGGQLQASAFHWRELRGYLVGSIDAVLRIDGRFFVVDYKTNRLGGPDSTLRDYRPEALPAAMMQADYPLQALLYGVALHRFLMHRLAGYLPQQHLGGIQYLFVRGMAGATTPKDGRGDPCGVFSWRPAPELVVELSARIGGER